MVLQIQMMMQLVLAKEEKSHNIIQNKIDVVI